MRNDFREGTFLMHGGLWKNTKYVGKVKLPSGAYRYFYNAIQYQNYLNGGKTNNAKKNPNEDKVPDAVKKQLSSDETVQKLVAQKTAGKTKGEKAANLKNAINKGSEKIDSLLSGDKKNSGSGGSSKKSKGILPGTKGAKGGSSSKSSKGSGEGKGKSSSSSKSAAKQQTAKQTAKKKTAENTPITMDSLKKIYGAKDEDVATHNVSAPEFKNKMLSKYDEGSFGYLMAGDKAYKWTIENGQFILKDFDTDKEVSADTYLKNVNSFKEFQTNKKKK